MGFLLDTVYSIANNGSIISAVSDFENQFILMQSNKLYNQYRADKEARKAMEKEAEIAEAYQQRAQQLAVAERQRLDALKSEIISKLKNAEKLAKVVGKQFDGFEYLAMQMSKLEQKSQKRQVPDFDTSELDAATAALFK